jgi:hypothetical protein
MAREREESQLQMKRVQQELELRERKHSARHLVMEAIEERLSGNGPVPEAISSLMYEGWQQVLLAAYLREGKDGPEWRDAMRTVDRLVWSVQPKIEYEDRRELLRSIPELLRTLREALAQVSYDQRRLARWFRELQALHIAALRGAGPEPARRPLPARPSDAPADSSVVDSADAVATVAGADSDGMSLEGLGLEQGTWIEMRRDDGEPMRVRLAWRSPQTGVYLFVDRRGRRAMELAGSDILTLRRQGTLTVLGDTPIVDRAMDEVVQALKSRPGT